MASNLQIEQAISSGQAYYLQLLDADTANRQVGLKAKNGSKLRCLNRLMSALGWDLAISVNDSITTAIYELLLSAIAAYNGTGLVVDPSVIIPGQNVTIYQVVSFNNDKILFNNVSTFSLLNYNTTFKQLYGNNPILAVYLNSEFGDYQDIPDIIYATPGDPTSDILSITYTFATPVSGYISISGAAPGVGGSSSASGGTGAIPFTFTQAALVWDSVNSQWYLPLPLPVGLLPSVTESNGVTIPSAYYDTTFSPPRLYGFADNNTQAIIVKVI